ncbi:hypothetical protein E2562_002197 [Oryza meyeriana var. granulata]|uniref:Uncharacterized protein n=1 Tax=Oryza meyeriana var. granulata TaxID=110450 RepID=A0A6G1EE05_9ORYZ|nr:hypothetical protein E2562_002197 [Oryza meyeriana var. granulata]
MERWTRSSKTPYFRDLKLGSGHWQHGSVGVILRLTVAELIRGMTVRPCEGASPRDSRDHVEWVQ